MNHTISVVAQGTVFTYPIGGWFLEQKRIHSPAAYTDFVSWLSHFEETFPRKAKGMHEYSKEKGWSRGVHNYYWSYFVIRYLNERGNHE